MKRFIFGLFFVMSGLMGAQCEAIYGNGAIELKLATGSPGELGLVEVLVNEFSKAKNVKVCWIKAGSGESLDMLKNSKVDIIMVHAPKSEIAAIKDGWAIQRTLIGSNEFYIIGPKSDPAGIKNAKNVSQAYKMISDTKSPFYTRADNSGTHKKELSIWKMAGVKPHGDWYIKNKDFMLSTLLKADKNGVYFMTDSSTWAVAIKDIKNSAILFRGDIHLINTYSALRKNSNKTDGDKMAKEFINFVASQKGQKIIRDFGKNKYSQSLYNDAAYAKKYFIEN
ncbi:substrate-binding domain-containing protein [Campylobacter sputorum]|uniref:substrate-binding domain-containing protein n=1 Tax=Campylobacter sputorum TaxID=206 RepID=UPI00053BF51B|nr:substrate-binding domain-containing protein [Campylobacter sputorum]